MISTRSFLVYRKRSLRAHDNASPHKAARKRLNELGSGYNRGAKIEMKNQSARSPDFNALDAYVWRVLQKAVDKKMPCLLYTSPSPRDGLLSRMPSSA